MTGPLFTPMEKARSPPSWRMLRRGGDGPLGVVLVGLRHAEDRHERVAHVLVDDAAVLGHLLGHAPEGGVDRARDRLGVAALGQRREAHDVGEQHGGELALVGRRDAPARRARARPPDKASPHCPQNRCSAGLAVPHDRAGDGARGSGVPQRAAAGRDRLDKHAGMVRSHARRASAGRRPSPAPFSPEAPASGRG